MTTQPSDHDRQTERDGLWWSFLLAMVMGLGAALGGLLPFMLMGVVIVAGISAALGVSLKTAMVLAVVVTIGLGLFAASQS
ncbi:hypothetical protein [Actibacterium sp. 188UL27-1]|uniref:hypothetical protein n=1 Tax=Actibacterium sp. 188UL27-1 TaxID=2786961 RepID=UPI0019573AE9|nr:hypothetical protein [Actibacterium sp. 188UL27-1]MBM7066982.1 hypothetical protein [Actibacterium sp. 188UL27-1]